MMNYAFSGGVKMSAISVVSDGDRAIPYNKILSFFDVSLNETSELGDEVNAVIIDRNDDAAIADTAAKVRGMRPDIPLLFIEDYITKNKTGFLRNIPGYGPVSLLYWRSEYPEQLLEKVETLMHQEYSSVRNDIAVILPVYNEEARIENVYSFLKKLRVFMEKAFLNTTIYFINDGSADNTQKVIDHIIAQESEDVNIVHREPFFSLQNLQKNTRKAGTYIQGIQSIKADILVFADADDSFRIEDISKMINILREGYYDMVVGTKDLTAENRPPIRRLMSFGKRRLTSRLLPPGVYDSQTGLKAMNAVAARHILHHLHEENGLAIDLEMMYLARKLRFRVLQMPVVCIDREGSHVDIIRDSLRFLRSIRTIPKMNRGVSYGTE